MDTDAYSESEGGDWVACYVGIKDCRGKPLQPVT